jgi:hypothetical protein
MILLTDSSCCAAYITVYDGVDLRLEWLGICEVRGEYLFQQGGFPAIAAAGVTGLGPKIIAVAAFAKLGRIVIRGDEG